MVDGIPIEEIRIVGPGDLLLVEGMDESRAELFRRHSLDSSGEGFRPLMQPLQSGVFIAVRVGLGLVVGVVHRGSRAGAKRIRGPGIQIRSLQYLIHRVATIIALRLRVPREAVFWHLLSGGIEFLARSAQAARQKGGQIYLSHVRNLLLWNGGWVFRYSG